MDRQAATKQRTHVAAGARTALIDVLVIATALMIRQLDGDVNMEELAEVARLESGAATIENPLSVTAVQIVRAQAVAADAQ